MSVLFMALAPYEIPLGAFVITYLFLVLYDVAVLVTCIKVLFNLGD